MAVSKKIISFLEKNKVKYEILKHRTVYTAFDKAKTLKIPEKMVGKTLVLKTDGKLAMVLIPANKNLDLQKFKKLAKALPAACLPDRQGRQVKYEILKHRTVYTAYDKAQTLKVPEKIVGKTLILKMDGKLTVVLIPANKNLDLQKFKKLAKALPAACLPDRQGRQVKKIDFASERLIKNKFKGVKVGAIPPFGNLWGLRTFIDNFLISLDFNFIEKL